MNKLNPNFLDKQSIHLLSLIKIYTVIDFLQADIEKIVSHSNLTHEKVLQLKDFFIKRSSSHTIVALNEIHSMNSNVFIRTYIERLDELLEGGLLKGSILELCGTSGCGKTQLCHSIAVNCCSDNSSVQYIDTKGDFSASHCNSLLREGLKDEVMDNILEQIRVYSTKNIYELISVLNNIYLNSKRNIDEKDKILIIDSIAVPYLPFTGISVGKGISILNYIASTLKLIATECNTAVVLVNLGVIYHENEDQFSTYSEEIKPLLGKYWKHIPNTRVIISQSENKKTISIQKSDYLVVNRSCTFSKS